MKIVLEYLTLDINENRDGSISIQVSDNSDGKRVRGFSLSKMERRALKAAL